MKSETKPNVTLVGFEWVRHWWWPWALPHPVTIELTREAKKSAPPPDEKGDDDPRPDRPLRRPPPLIPRERPAP